MKKFHKHKREHQSQMASNINQAYAVAGKQSRKFQASQGAKQVKEYKIMLIEGVG